MTRPRLDDPVADLIYRGAMGYMLGGIKAGPAVLDLGGGDGMSREFLPGRQVVTVDSDPGAGADVTADITTYTPDTAFDTVLLRYVLHYLPDPVVRHLFRQIADWHWGNVVVIQFANEDTGRKAANSADTPHRFWRTPGQVLSLLRWLPQWRLGRVNRLDYTVTPEFYAGLLGTAGVSTHSETLLGMVLERPVV